MRRPRPTLLFSLLLSAMLLTAGASGASAQAVVKQPVGGIPVAVTLDPPLATAVVGGNGFQLALLLNGDVWAWGANTYGQLGQGYSDAQSHPIPMRVPGLSNVIAIQAGDDFALALQSDGQLFSWGRNNQGQLGWAEYECSLQRHWYSWGSVVVGGSCPDTAHATPTRVLTSIRTISAGRDYAFALETQYGNVQAWGNNVYGQLSNYFLPSGPNGGAADPRPPLVPTPHPVWDINGRTISVRDVIATDRTGRQYGSYGLALANDGTLIGWPSPFNGTSSDPVEPGDYWAHRVADGDNTAYFSTLRTPQNRAGDVTLGGPHVGWLSSSLSFDSVFVPLAYLHQPQTLTATWGNFGPGSVLVGTPTFAFGAAGQFSVVSWTRLNSTAPCPALLLPYEGCTAKIAFTPTTTGTLTASLRVPSSAATGSAASGDVHFLWVSGVGYNGLVLP